MIYSYIYVYVYTALKIILKNFKIIYILHNNQLPNFNDLQVIPKVLKYINCQSKWTLQIFSRPTYIE